ncbi:hypothetical protein [Roseibium aquae]|nr:hypothetical protein [Roseibium aquae]
MSSLLSLKGALVDLPISIGIGPLWQNPMPERHTILVFAFTVP